MIQTMSGPNDWFQFYHQNFPTSPSISESTTVTTTTTTTAVPATAITTSPPVGMLNSSSPASTHLSPEGRVSKAGRRRSRASRRTPTTLLNTDTTNFRAMVQQFTGGPSAPFAPTASPATGLPNLMGFGFGSRPVPPVNPTTLMVSHPGYHLQQQQQHLYYQPQNQQQQQQQQYMYSGATQGGGGGDNTFFQRLSNPRPPNNVVTDHDGVLMDHGHGGGHFFPSTSSS